MFLGLIIIAVIAIGVLLWLAMKRDPSVKQKVLAAGAAIGAVFAVLWEQIAGMFG